jgi:hypothetical protein
LRLFRAKHKRYGERIERVILSALAAMRGTDSSYDAAVFLKDFQEFGTEASAAISNT